MKTFVVLCALACSALAAPTQYDQNQRNWPNREKKSPTFGSLGGHGVHESIGHGGLHQHGLHNPHLHQEHLGLKKPLFHHGHHDIHHGLGHGLGHHGHGFRNEEEEKDAAVTEVTELKSAENIDEKNMEVGLESNIKMAKDAVETMQRDLVEMENAANSKSNWKHSDSKTDATLHENIETAKAALRNVEISFENMQAINDKKMSGKDAESVQDPIDKMTEEERMAKWKSAIETIQKNVEIANNIKESFTSGKPESQGKIIPNHEARTSSTKPVIVEPHKKPNLDKKDLTEMEMSASTKVEMRDDDEKQDGEVMMEKSSWNHKTDVKTAESPLETNDKISHLEHDTLKTSMKTSEPEGIVKNAEKKIDSIKVAKQKSVDFKAAEPSIISAQKEHMPQESHEAREDLEVSPEQEKSAHHDIHQDAHHDSHNNANHNRGHAMKPTDGTVLNTKATMKFGSEESNHESHKQNFDHHNKPMRHQGHGKSAVIDTTTLMKESDAKSSMKQSEMDHQASEMKSSQVMFEKDHQDTQQKKSERNDMKSIDTATHPVMQAAMRNADEMKMEKDLKHHESARTFSPASYGPSVAVVSSSSYGPSAVVNAGYGSAAPSYGPSAPAPVSYGASAPVSHSYGPSVSASAPSPSYAPSAPVSHSYNAPSVSYAPSAVAAPASYGASASSYGSGSGSSGISINLSGSGPSGAVGVFPNAKVGGCAVPLLLSCSPSVVSGSLAKAHPSYSGSASYKANEQQSFHTKREVKINELPAKKARRSFSPTLDKQF